MSRGRHGLRDRWRRDVLASTDLPDAAKVTLMAKSLWMSDQGYVSVPRKVLADLLGKDLQSVKRHVARAIELGLLQKVGGGYRGRTAEYVAVLPNLKGVVPGPPLESDSSSSDDPLWVKSPLRNAPKGVHPMTPHYARVTTQTRKRTDGERDVRVERDHDQEQGRRDEEAPAHSALAAASRNLSHAGTATDNGVGSKTASSVNADQDPRCGNPPCQSCGRRNLYSPASITRGICATCIQKEMTA